jgi:hypothetical protein
MNMRAFNFSLYLEAFLPIRIAEYQRRGGPTDADFDRIQTYADEIAGKTDIFHGADSGKAGDVGRLAGKILDAVAVLSFLPGESQAGGQIDAIGELIKSLREVKS